MTVRNVKKNLAGLQDLLLKVGTSTQIRRGQSLVLDGVAKSYIELWKSFAGVNYVGTFEDGCIVDSVGDIVVSLFDGKAYSYTGTSPKTVDYTTDTGTIDWVECTSTLRAAIYKLIKRVYAEAGLNLVSGSFQTGGILSSATDILLDEANWVVYAYTGTLPHTVVAGTPSSSAGFVSKEPITLRSQLAASNGYTLVGGAASQGDVDKIRRDYNFSAAVIAGRLIAGTTAGTKIHFFGDSTMWGSNPAPNTTVQQATNPPAMFKIGLDIMYPGNGVTIANKAIAGSNLYSMMRGINNYYPNTYESVIAADTPSVAYCGHCLNDCSSSDGDTNIVTYYNDLLNFVDISRAYGVIPVLVTPAIHAPLGSGTIAQTKRQESFVQAMRDVAEKKNVDLVDSNYYMQKSLRLWTPMSIAPDGVHLSPMFSSQHGFNMLIPLVRPHSLKLHNDLAGLSNTVWQDNLPDVFNKITNTAQSRFGPNLLGEGATSVLKINFPILLEDATDDTFIAFGGSAFDTCGISSITYFDGYGTTGILSGNIDASQAVATSDALIAPALCKLPAGLAIVGVSFPANTQLGKVFTFSGIGLFMRNFSGNGSLLPAEALQLRPILNGDKVRSSVTLASGTELLRLAMEDAPATTVINVKWDTGSNSIVIVHPGGTTTLWASPVANAAIQVEIAVDYKSFVVKMGGLSQTITGLTRSLPKLIVVSQFSYTVTRL